MKTRCFHAAVVLIATASMSCTRDNQPQDTLVRLDTLPPCTEDFTDYAEFINAHQFGIGVQNLYHHNILFFASRKAPWRPISGRREALGGRLRKYFVATVHPDQNEFDWNLDVVPSAAFAPRMGEGMVECEVTPAMPLRENRFFPPKGSGKASPLLGQDICLYGPWVRDEGNENQREIHPAEAIWWQNRPGRNADVELILLQDAAIHRFTELADFDFDEDQDGTDDFQPGWAPWVKYPQMEEVELPFQFDPKTGRYSVVEIEEERSLNVVTRLFRELDDSDNGADHRLRGATRLGTSGFNQPTLAEVHESRDSNLGIQFTDLCRSPAGAISGNIRVLAAIGRPNTRNAGFMVLRFVRRVEVNSGPVATQ